MYKKGHFRNHNIQQNCIFEIPSTKNGIFEIPLYKKLTFIAPSLPIYKWYSPKSILDSQQGILTLGKHHGSRIIIFDTKRGYYCVGFKKLSIETKQLQSR